MTLVEILVVVLITTIVIFGLGSVLAAGHRNWNDAWERVNLQRDAAFAMSVFSLPIKEATGAAVFDDIDGPTLTIYNLDGTETSFFLEPTEKELRRQVDTGGAQIIIKNMDNMEFEVIGNKVWIKLYLKKDDQIIEFETTISMRNFGLE